VVVLLLEIEAIAVAPVDGCGLEHAAVVLGVDALASHDGEAGRQSALHLLRTHLLVTPVLLTQHPRDSVQQRVDLLLAVAVQVDVKRVLPQHLLHLLQTRSLRQLADQRVLLTE
jgi:hypothetical protein